MKRFTFKKLDAFADGRSSGNPAGMVTVDSLADISREEMLQIARELRGFVNEVGFACRLGPDRLALRYYSAEKEVMFCGHATIAILYDLLSNDPELRQLARVHLEISQDSLIAENRVAAENAVFISAPAPAFSRCDIDPADIAAALGVETDTLSADLPTARINAGLETLLVPLVDLRTCLAVRPDEDILRSFCEKESVDIITLFTRETARKDTGWRSRVFAPRFGYLEDPATGSGNAALGHYLLQQQLWQGEILTIEQNSDRNSPNIVKIMARTTENGGPQVLVGGGAVCRIEGQYLLQQEGI